MEQSQKVHYAMYALRTVCAVSAFTAAVLAVNIVFQDYSWRRNALELAGPMFASAGIAVLSGFGAATLFRIDATIGVLALILGQLQVRRELENDLKIAKSEAAFLELELREVRKSGQNT